MSINVKVDFNESYFRKLGLNKGSYKQVITQTMTTGAVKAEEITRREAPVKTGNLRRSINHFVKGSSESGVLQHGADYWVGVEYGTGPHVITPKGGSLRFKVGGQYVFAKQVNHPGNRPNPFVRRSANKIKSQHIFQNAFRQSLTRMGITR